MKTTKKIPFEYGKNNVYWVISDACNYRCHYCFTQSKNSSGADPLLIADNFKTKLKGKWDFILSGGEPFIQKDFFKIVEKLTTLEQLNKIFIHTNFSASSQKIVKFLKTTEGRLSIFFASLHLDFVKPVDFFKKIDLVEKSFPSFKKHLLVNLTTAAEDLYLLEEIKKSFFEKGVQLLITPQLRFNLSFIKYSKKQRLFLNQLNKGYNLPEFAGLSMACGQYGLESSKVDFKGRKCFAGCRSFFISPYGDTYGCVAASRAKKNFLGNILKNDFKLNKKGMKCLFSSCHYPVSYEQYFWQPNKNK
jgi:sulfatase maturation enzyme AslB (radical SAM superfamily)